MKKTLLLLLSFLIFNCSKSKSETEQICDCVKDATNYYISKGYKATVNDLTIFCKRESLTSEDFSSEEKKKIIETIEDALLKIENKEFFEDFKNEGIPSYKTLDEFEVAYDEFVAKYPNGDRDYFSKKVRVSDIVLVEFDETNYLANEHYNKDEFKISTYKFVNNEKPDVLITIELDKKVKKDLIFATKINEYPSDAVYQVENRVFNQIMTFEDAEIVNFSKGHMTLKFPTKIEFRKPIKGKDAIYDSTDFFSLNYNDDLKGDIHDKNISNTDNISPNEISENNVYKKVKVEKAYFYENPNIDSKKKSYLIKGQDVEVLSLKEKFSNVKYTNDKGKITIGYLLNEELSD